MRVTIDTSALETGYRIQGVGNYIKHLKDGLEKIGDENEYIFYSGQKLPKNTDLAHIPYFSPYQRKFPITKPATKVIVTIHDLIPVVFHEYFPAGWKGSFNWYMQKYFLKRNVDHVITNSESTKKDVMEHLGFMDNNVFTTYLGADEKFKPLNTNQRKLHRELRDKYRIPEKFVLYVGDILWSKNVPGLIEAVRKINVTLVMVGKQMTEKNIDVSHPWNKDLVFARKAAQEDERIMPLGYIPDEDLIKLYNMASVYTAPSHYEGFGFTVLEAMRCGCPVVVSEEGALPEVTGDAGMYVEAGDPRSIADGIGEIYFNPEKYKEYSKKALEQATKFSWTKTVAETIKVYEKFKN